MKHRKLISLLIVFIMFLSMIQITSANATTLSSLFTGYNVVTATVTNGVYLRGAPCTHSTANPVYFYKINGNNIYIASGKTVYVLEKENNYYYIAYLYNGTYYCGYVPMSDISCSGASWCNHDIYWVADLVDGSTINTCYGPGAATYFTRWGSISSSSSSSSIDLILLKRLNGYAFIQYRINGSLVRTWMWGNYITEYGSHGSEDTNHYFTNQTRKYDYSNREAGDSTVYFINASTNKALTVSSTASGTVLTVAEFNGSEQQEFTILKTDTYSTVYKIYSQYADMVLEVDDCLVNGSYLRTKAISDPNKKQEFIIRAEFDPEDNIISIDTNTFLSIRGSGGYSSLTVNDSNQVIMTDCGNTSAYQWHISPKLYDGGAIYFSNNAANITYNLVNITNGTIVTRSMIARAAEYWNKTPNSKITISDPSSSATGIFDIMLVNSSDVPSDYSNAYAYFESYNTSNILDEDGDGEGYTGYHTTTEHSQVINWYWEGTIIYIIKDNIEADIQNGNLLASDIHKVIAHEFGHALKQPHPAVNNKITSIMNTGNFTYYPTFTNTAVSETDDGISFAAYDSNRALEKNYSA